MTPPRRRYVMPHEEHDPITARGLFPMSLDRDRAIAVLLVEGNQVVKALDPGVRAQALEVPVDVGLELVVQHHERRRVEAGDVAHDAEPRALKSAGVEELRVGGVKVSRAGAGVGRHEKLTPWRHEELTPPP